MEFITGYGTGKLVDLLWQKDLWFLIVSAYIQVYGGSPHREVDEIKHLQNKYNSIINLIGEICMAILFVLDINYGTKVMTVMLFILITFTLAQIAQ